MAVVFDEAEMKAAWLNIKKEPAGQAREKFIQDIEPLLQNVSSKFPQYIQDDLVLAARAHFWKKFDNLLANYDSDRGRLFTYLYHFLEVFMRYCTAAELSRDSKAVPLKDSEFEPIVEKRKSRRDVSKVYEIKCVMESWVKVRYLSEIDRRAATQMLYMMMEGKRPNWCNSLAGKNGGGIAMDRKFGRLIWTSMCLKLKFLVTLHWRSGELLDDDQ